MALPVSRREAAARTLLALSEHAPARINSPWLRPAPGLASYGEALPSLARRCLGEGVLHRPSGQLGAASQPGLLAHAREVVLHCARRDVQDLRDLLVRGAGG